MEIDSDVQAISFLGYSWPRKCGIGMFTSDLLSAMTTEHRQSQQGLSQSLTWELNPTEVEVPALEELLARLSTTKNKQTEI